MSLEKTNRLLRNIQLEINKQNKLAANYGFEGDIGMRNYHKGIEDMLRRLLD